MIYNVLFPAPPNITPLGFTHGPQSSSLTCTSSGSPATTVTWMRDGQPLTIDGGLYQLSQTVTNRSLSTYENVLTINAAMSYIYRHTYTCTVTNVLGSKSKTVLACKFYWLGKCLIQYRCGDYVVSASCQLQTSSSIMTED